ncbi:mitochondrial import inner membrane translocase subunit Tim13 [Ricinus communis]|uniref:Mitochondrial import inner membrane translocase subunit n=1 Tax=Ricinus communis TaxID=3988 RepID=B9RYX8_RICCO|nr:mitochondrial import inner membrane translocase subunit Tim13 [Ricinus communis]EEF43480.1 Mitochondrial import inner membrane translocase subunit Tim13, putative [Ricinus communis]|eukprot:XP_002518947.1 mitochondrial import inner membrane translocase subunit Tim13 [Ricinus communis]
MDTFSSPSSIGTGSQVSTSDLMDQVKTQLAQAYAQEFLETVRGKCFDKCITKPGSSLSGSESSCISRCVDRYIEATGIVSRALFNAPH